jgi:hypothetical protein
MLIYNWPWWMTPAYAPILAVLISYHPAVVAKLDKPNPIPEKIL